MMQFTPQQSAGGGKYHYKTKIGNWLEDLEIEEMKYGLRKESVG